MGKKQTGHGGHHSKKPGKSPRFRTTQRIELKQQEDVAKTKAAKRKAPMTASTVDELFHPKKK